MIDKFFKDKDDKIVIVQWPNWPVWGWLFARLVLRLTSQGALHNFLEFTSASLILVWASMEIYSGVNIFRRLLGLTILIITILGFAR